MVLATVVPAENENRLDMESLKEQLKEAGFGRLELAENICLTLLRKVKNCELDEVQLGKLPPCMAVRFEYKDDTRELFAVIEQVESGEEPSFHSIKSDLEDAGFGSFPIKNTDISNLLLKVKNAQVGKYAISKKPEFTKLRFSFDEESNALYAELSATEEEVLMSRETIQVGLKDGGYTNYYFEPNALDKLFNQINKNERGTYKIGERRDAAVSVTFDEEMMHAYMSVSPPQGGRDLDDNLLKKALDDAGIYAQCCDEKVLAKVVKEKSAENLLFATGKEPKDGSDASFEALVEEVIYSKPKETKTGKIDLREVVRFSLIEAGVDLMRRTPAIEGENGRNVKGQVITAREALDTPFDEDLPGAAISDSDPNVLVSICKGHPVIMPSGVKVDNSIEVENVDMSTGNINYDGSVLVRGEVKAGMEINVTGSIIVKGVVTKASLHAKNDITIECGVVGTDPKKDDNDSPPAVLKAGGNVKAQYLNLTEVHATGNVEVKEYISHCDVEAKKKVLVGQGGGKGKVFGGSCYGKVGVEANSIGANGDVKTLIVAGTSSEQQKQFDQLLEVHKNRTQQYSQLSALEIKYQKLLKENPTDIDKANKIKAIKKVIEQLDGEMEKMVHTINSVNQHLREVKKASIAVVKETFSNAIVSINGAEFKIKQESKGGIFVKEGEDIRWMNYKKP